MVLNDGHDHALIRVTTGASKLLTIWDTLFTCVTWAILKGLSVVCISWHVGLIDATHCYRRSPDNNTSKQTLFLVISTWNLVSFAPEDNVGPP